MATTMTLIHGAAPSSKARRFSSVDAGDVCRNATEARAICRAVALAAAAQLDGAVVFENPEASRWHASIDAACELLQTARDTLIETADAPTNCDWWTPLNLLQALGAAMWRCAGPGADQIDHEEVAAFLHATIASLDALLLQCQAIEAESTT